MKLADECAAQASVQESEDASDDAKDDRTVWQARPDDDGVA